MLLILKDFKIKKNIQDDPFEITTVIIFPETRKIVTTMEILPEDCGITNQNS